MFHQEHPSLSKGGDGHESSPAVPDAAGNDILIEGIDVSFSQPTDPGLPQPHPLPPITPGVATPAADPTSTQSVPEEGKKEEQEKGTTESHPRGASENTSSNVGEDTLAARDAEVCDLLLGYFRYCAEEFCHSKQVSEKIMAGRVRLGGLDARGVSLAEGRLGAHLLGVGCFFRCECLHVVHTHAQSSQSVRFFFIVIQV